MGELDASQSDASAFAFANDDSYGSVSFTLPDQEQEETYNVVLYLYKLDLNGAVLNPSTDEVMQITTSVDGVLQTSTPTAFKVTWREDLGINVVQVTLSKVAAGSTLDISGILVQFIEYDSNNNIQWYSYDKACFGIDVTNDNNAAQKITIEGGSPFEVFANQTTTVAYHLDAAEAQTTTDTFLSLTGQTDYNLLFLLNNYNVVSFDDIESEHIVGPIIAADYARRTTEEVGVKDADANENLPLAASDYSRGMFSYAGRLDSYSNGTLSSLTMNYWFDRVHTTDFIAPYFYTKVDGIAIDTVGSIENVVLETNADGITPYFLSPNDSGAQSTYQNNDFIDFEAMAAAIVQDSQDILTNGGLESTVQESERYVYKDGVVTLNDVEVEGRISTAQTSTAGVQLLVNAGESWMIETSENLEVINFVHPDDYDYYTNPYLPATTVNFVESVINPIIIDGVSHSQFPDILINGEQLLAYTGENGEYGEVGNKIIWNLPNVVTTEDGVNRLVTFADGQNIPGHIIAPQAEFWNYSTDGSYWEGGNINGCVIVKSFYSGAAEMHMWPYDGAAEQAVLFHVEALKTVDGNEPTYMYEFELDVVRDADGNIPDGIMNTSFPMMASSNLDEAFGDIGAVWFSSIAFDKEGTYSFIVKEVVPENPTVGNVDYDLSQYLIEVTVASTAVDDTTTYEISYVVQKLIVDEDGNVQTEAEIQESTSSRLNITFNNKITEGTVDIHFTKVCETGHLLAGAKFYVTEMTSATDETLPTGGYFESVISDISGDIAITNLEKGTYYKLIEYEAPSGHIKADGYWILYINENGYLESITPMDGAQELVDNTIVNAAITSMHLDLTLTKANQVGETIAGVDFRVQRVVIENGVPVVVANGYDETVQSDADGTFTIYDLETEHIYMLTETSTPDEHVEHDGYWLITVEGDDKSLSQTLTYTIVEYSASHTIVSTATNDVIYNQKLVFSLPDTGGMGSAPLRMAGAGCLFVGVVLYQKRRRGKPPASPSCTTCA